jgi:SAM-dependent methyltransferase
MSSSEGKATDAAILATTPGQVQVTPQHYVFERYDDLRRWCSYWYQIRSALRLSPRRVLEIGSGTGVFKSYLKNLGIHIDGMDIDATRKPEIIGSVRELDTALAGQPRYDMICAFQVLEHLPFDDFEPCLDQLAKHADHVLISLPCHGFELRLALAIAGLKLRTGIYGKYPFRFKRESFPEHYWELGTGYSVRKITRLMEQRFEVIERRHVPDNPYHYMWSLRSRA